jgi:hypothetical protein
MRFRLELNLMSEQFQFLAAEEEAAEENVLKDSEGIGTSPIPDYFHVMMPAQIAPFGLSQRAFREVSLPYATSKPL